jgi:hypothetical protein
MKKVRGRDVFISQTICFLVLALMPMLVWATTRNVTCSGDITSAMNSAISASSSGDIVNIGSGSCKMSALNMMSDKAITIQGAGASSTIITANSGWGQIEFTGSNSPSGLRLTGFTLTSTATPGAIITVWANQSASWRGPFRFDHLTLNYPNNGPDGAIALFGPIHGLIDNCSFTQSYEAHILTSFSLSSETGDINSLHGSYGATLAFSPGSSTYLYIEDCTFTGGSAGASAIDTDRTGGRVVFRHNTVTNGNLYAHWSSEGNWNSLWWEVYNNKFILNTNAGQPIGRMQGGGTGLIYNNTAVGYSFNSIEIGEDRLTRGGSPLSMCSGSNNWDGKTDSSASGWPCLSQTGRDAGKTMAQIQAGNKQASFPLYLWNNGPQCSCSGATYPCGGGTSGACSNNVGVSADQPTYFKSTAHSTSGFGNGDVDYSITAGQPSGAGTHTLTYNPYTYPHPLRGGGGGGTTIPPPSNLRSN